MRVPPFDDRAEQAVLGAVLLNEGALGDALEVLAADDFYRDAHRIVFEAMRTIDARRGTVDIVTVGEALQRAGQLEAVGGIGFLDGLQASVPNVAAVGHYARLVKQKSLLRKLIASCHETAGEGYDQTGDFEEIVARAQNRIIDIAQSSVSKPYVDAKTAVTEAFADLERTWNDPEQLQGVPTGFADLDQMTLGLQRGNLVIIAARPAMGKTAFVLNLAANSSIRGHKSVAVFSLEMSTTEIAIRLLCAEASRTRPLKPVSSLEVRRPGARLGKDDHDALSGAADELARARLFIDDTAGLRTSEVRAKCRRIQASRGLDLVIIDYLQLMSHDGRADSREQQISSISRALKMLAKDLKVPVIALSQLNRELEKRPDKRPALSDLRESGAIEQDADVIMFLHREEYFRKETGQGDVAAPDQNLAELIVAKQRSGPTGTVRLNFYRDATLFLDRIDERIGDGPGF